MENFVLVATVFARIVGGGLFIVAGWSKLHAGESFFLRTVLAYELLPRPLAAVMARLLPPVEIMIGFMLLLGLLIQPVAYLGLALLILFTGAVVIALLQKRTISCGCFGPKERVTPMRWTIIVRNLAIMLMLGVVSIQNTEIFTLDSLWKNHVGSAGHWYINLGIVVVLVLLSYLYAQFLTVSSSQSKTSA